MKELFQAQRLFCEAVLAGNQEQIENARRRVELLQKAHRMRRETSQTLRVALALDISI
jgi:hypothetical protein